MARITTIFFLWVLVALRVFAAPQGSSTSPDSPVGKPPAMQSALWKFDFGSPRSSAGWTAIQASTQYSDALGYGFESHGTPLDVDRGGDAVTGDFVATQTGCLFSVKLPEGNYEVAVTVGDPKAEGNTTVKAESRRLMLDGAITAAGQSQTLRFTVNIRDTRLKSGGTVGIKAREKGYLHWDSKLTLEFNGPQCCIASLEIRPAGPVPVLWLLGDSTVTDQPYEPWNSWGQMIPRFFKPGIAVANYAESGESIRSSIAARRVQKVMDGLKSGDFVCVQFGHNDMKDRHPEALARYEAQITSLVDDVLKKGASPVLITSMERKSGVQKNTLAGYPDALRNIARNKGIPCIDLHAMSQKLYAAIGNQLDAAFVDGTHHNAYGSYEIARCVALGMHSQVPGLASWLVDEASHFDPSKPDPLSTFRVPPSPMQDTTKPDGN